MAGWCDTTCSPNLIWEVRCRTVGETLTIETGVVWQTRTARTKDQAGTTDTNHARHLKWTHPKRGNQNRRESITLHLWRTIEWWHRRKEVRIQIKTLSPVATHGLFGSGFEPGLLSRYSESFFLVSLSLRSKTTESLGFKRAKASTS